MFADLPRDLWAGPVDDVVATFAERLQATDVTLVGAKTRAQLADALVALEKTLHAPDLEALDLLLPKGSFVGDRYAKDQMAHLDSER